MKTLSRLLLALLFTGALLSCEPTELTEMEQQIEQADTIKYTKEQLKEILKKERINIEEYKASRVVDISGMEVVKSNPKKVYVHYMPWFQSKDYDGYWGQHWTMTNRNPDNMDSTGTREIASYFYPLIGPYSSKDPDLHEYHFLLMKMAGVDGVIFDWYGSRDLYDYQLIKESTETFMATLDDLGLGFSIMYEDRVAVQAAAAGLEPSAIVAAQNDFLYMHEKYFTKNAYLKYEGNNLLFVFGPHHLTNQEEWNEIFSVLPANHDPDFVSLWASKNKIGQHAVGEFLWVDKDHLLAHDHYYNYYPQFNHITVGGVYPGFKSYYSQGGWSDGVNDWELSHDNGNTFVETLNYSHHEVADLIQLVTWNDFGEGTMIEPTKEHGFMYLQLLQQYTGVTYTGEDLFIAVDLYKARKKYAGNQEVQDYLDQSYRYIKQGKLKDVRLILTAVEALY